MGEVGTAVTDAEVTRRLGTSREEVGRMITQSGFPEPLGMIDSRSPESRNVPFWRWADVDAWACDGGHAPLRGR